MVKFIIQCKVSQSGWIAVSDYYQLLKSSFLNNERVYQPVLNAKTGPVNFLG